MTRASDAPGGRIPSRIGPTMIGAGCLFGLAPLIVSVVALFFGSGIGNVLHWYTFITAPIGLCIVVVGIVLASRRRSTSEPPSADAALPLDATLRDAIRLRFTVGSAIALVAAIVGFVAAGSGSGMGWGDSIGIGSLIAAGLAVWVGLSARKISSAQSLKDFRVTQLVASVLIIIGNLGTVLSVLMSFAGFLDGVDYYEWSAGHIASLVSALAITALAIASIVYSERTARGQWANPTS